MPQVYEPYELDWKFNQPVTLSTTAGPGGWAIKDTSSSGTPTYAVQAAGEGLLLQLASTSEAEVVTLYNADILSYALSSLHSIEWWFELTSTAHWSATGAGTNAHNLSIGVASAQNDTVGSMTTLALMRVIGAESGTLYYGFETDDNTTDTAPVNSSFAIDTNVHKLAMDFTQGLGSVQFYLDGRRVCPTTTFNMSAGGNVQPFVQVSKSGSTGVPAVKIHRCNLNGARVYA